MNNTINVNYMTRTYSNFLKNNEAKGNASKSPSFCDRVAEKSTTATETGKAGTVSAKDMTMDEYKQYIHEKISQIPMHPTRMSENISIHISEAGFEASVQEEANAKAAMEKSDAHRRLMSQWAKEAVYSDSVLARSGTAATANAAYEANFVMADNSSI